VRKLLPHLPYSLPSRLMKRSSARPKSFWISVAFLALPVFPDFKCVSFATAAEIRPEMPDGFSAEFSPPLLFLPILTFKCDDNGIHHAQTF